MKEIGSEFSLGSDKDYYFNRISRIGRTNKYLRCGRDALGYIANSITKKSGVILMPAYCCNSMVEPFIIRGWSIAYYPINQDLSVDVQYLVVAYEQYQPDALLLMNFFGLCDTRNIVDFIKTKWPGLLIMEDITHTLFDLEKSYTEQVDYYIGSIRKWMGITDGALVISTKIQMPDIPYIESDYVTLRRKGLNLKEEYLHSDDSSIKPLFRKVLSDAENSLENGKTPYLISPDAQHMLENLNVEPLKNCRKRNTNILLRLLKTIPEINYPENIDQILQITPFSVPILIKNRDYIQNKMAERGVYAALLWPLSKDAKNISPFAAKLERTMLSLPIDQRYDAHDMKHIYKVIKKLVKE